MSAAVPLDEPRPPTVDVSAWPLVRIVLYAGAPELVDPFVAELLALAKRGPFVTLADCRQATVVDAATRKRLFDGFQRVQETGAWRAEAIVLDDPILRGVVTAYSWVRRAKAPLRTFATLDEAERWMASTLRQVV